jgi:Carboxypeptidase regulatory-like domain
MTEEPPTPEEPDRRRPAVRIAVLGAVAVVVLVGIVVLGRQPRHHAATGSGSGSGSGAMRVPDRPQTLAHPDGARLLGFVVDGAGLPVAGAEVSAEPEHGAADRALAGSAAGVDAGASDAGVAIAVGTPTGGDGRFTIEGLQPGRYRVHVTGPGLLAAEVRYVPVPSDAARIVVARQVSIDGTVTDGGKPVANASVGLRGDAIGGTIETTTDASGAFHFTHLPEGRYQLWAWQHALAARTVRIARIGSGPFGPTELRLEAATIVVGHVIDREEGTGLVAAIELRPSGDDQAPRYARTASDGTFRIEGVPNGHWIADAFAPGYNSPNGVELDAGHGVTELALVPGGFVEGHVLGADGAPIAGATVRAIVEAPVPGAKTTLVELSEQVDQDRLRRFSGHTVSAAPPSLGMANDPQLVARGELGVMVGPIPPIPPPGAQVARPTAVVDPAVAGGANATVEPLPTDPAHASIWTTGVDGRYRIRGTAKGKLTVLAQAPGYAEARSKPVAVAAKEAHTGVDIVLSRGTFVVGRVSDEHGAPISGAELSAQPDVGTPLEAFTDAAGDYRLGPVTGTIALHVRAYGHGETTRTLELDAKAAAERREDIVLARADAMIAGTVDDVTGAPVVGAQLEVVVGAEGRRAVAASDGTFSIDMLPAGHLRLRVEHPAYPAQEVDAVASSDNAARLRIRLALGGAVEGALLDGASGAPLSSVTLTGIGPSGATAEASTDKVGRWKLGPLKPGHWKISVALAGYLPVAREVDVPASSAPGATSVRDVRIDLPRGALVGGTVRDANGRRVAGAHVVIRGADITVEGDTDAQGEFRVRDAPTGQLEVTAARGDARGTTTATVRPGDELLGLAIEIR